MPSLAWACDSCTPRRPRHRRVSRGVGPAAVARGRRRRRLVARDGAPARASGHDHARTPHGGGRASSPGRRRRRGGRGRPRRQVDLPRPRAAGLLPDPRPDPPRPGCEAVLPRPRGGAHPDPRRVRRRGHADRGTDRCLAGAPAAQIASIGIHLTRWISTHGYALNVDLDPAPFTDWITACGLENAAFTTMARELARPLSVDEVKPVAAAALAEIFGLAFEERSAATLLAPAA